MELFGCENSCLECKRNTLRMFDANFARYHKICTECCGKTNGRCIEKICGYCESRVTVFPDMGNKTLVDVEGKSVNQNTDEIKSRGAECSLPEGLQQMNSGSSSIDISNSRISNYGMPEGNLYPDEKKNKESQDPYPSEFQHSKSRLEEIYANPISSSSSSSVSLIGIKCKDCNTFNISDTMQKRSCFQYVCNDCIFSKNHSYCRTCNFCFLCISGSGISNSYCHHKFCEPCLNGIGKLNQCPICTNTTIYQCQFCKKSTYFLFADHKIPQCIICSESNYFCANCKIFEVDKDQFFLEHNAHLTLHSA